MNNLHIVLGAAGLLGLVFMALTVNVMRQRFATRTPLGDGADAPGKAALHIAVRSHANFAEYVPLCLLLIGGIAHAGANQTLVLGLCAALVAGRVMHPFGMVRPAPNVLRGGGMVLTWAVLVAASVAALLISLSASGG